MTKKKKKTKKSLTDEQLIAKAFRTRDVKLLCKAFFNVDILPSQAKIIRSIAFSTHNRIIVSCVTRYGKSWSVSMAILLWVLMNPDKRIAIIAPTNEKTRIIRNYMTEWIAQSPIFAQLLDLEKTGISRIRKEVSRKRMTWKNGVEMRTLSAEGKGKQLMGFGADFVICDEECDINYETYRSKITRMLGESKDSIYIGIGNPWHRDNQMYQHWINPDWHKIHIGWRTAVKEGRFSQDYIDEQQEILTAREFKILYEAKFPEESEDQLIMYDWIQDAITKPNNNLTGQLICGVDVARSGMDSTVFTYGVKTKENTYHVTGIKRYDQQDTMQTVSKLLQLHKDQQFDRITIDAGGLGAGVYDRLIELKQEHKLQCRIISYEGGRSSSQDFKHKTKKVKQIRTRFLNIKSEAYFRLRSFFEESRIKIIKHHTLVDQLNKMKWGLTSSEKIRIYDPGTKSGDTAEEKSPDYADSLCYFCWEGRKTGLVFGNLNL